jgi:hypothetical protein
VLEQQQGQEQQGLETMVPHLLLPVLRLSQRSLQLVVVAAVTVTLQATQVGRVVAVAVRAAAEAQHRLHHQDKVSLVAPDQAITQVVAVVQAKQETLTEHQKVVMELSLL